MAWRFTKVSAIILRITDALVDFHTGKNGRRPRQREVVQQPGEAIFVPSGWYHDCVEINQWVRLS